MDRYIQRPAIRTKVSSMCQVDPFGLTCPRNRRCTSGAYVCVQRHTVVWSTDKPRSAISSSTSRRLSENRRYHRTQVTIISAANWRLRNKGTRRNPIRSPYQIPSLEVATLPFQIMTVVLIETTQHDWLGSLQLTLHIVVFSTAVRLQRQAAVRP